MIWTEKKHPDELEGHFSPRIATAYELDSNTIVKASFQNGFRTPDAFYYLHYMAYKDAAETLGISFPSLGIETMDSYELNVHKYLPEHKVKIGCNLYYNIFEDLLSWKFYEDTGLFTPAELNAIKDHLGLPAPVRPGSILNSQEKIKAYGGEINATAKLLFSTQVSLSYGYAQLDNEQLMQYPKHQFKINTLTSFWDDKMHFSLDYLYNSEYSNTDLPIAHYIYRKDRHLLNMGLNYNIMPKATLSLIINNLFENDVPPMVFDANNINRGGLGYDERRIYLSLKLKI
jgi:outer membrane receptor protein involved in Fe transport